MQADPGLFYFYALVKPGEKVEAIEDTMLKEFHRIQAEPRETWNSSGQKIRPRRPTYFEQDSNFRHAMLLGEAETIGAGWRKVGQFVDRTRAVTAQDIQRVANQYLGPDTSTRDADPPTSPATLG